MVHICNVENKEAGYTPYPSVLVRNNFGFGIITILSSSSSLREQNLDFWGQFLNEMKKRGF